MILLNKHTLGLGLAGLILLSVFSVGRATGQESTIRYGRGVPMAVRSINNRALQYLAQTQNEDGSWSGGESGSGILAICVMAFIANGEDADYGPYADNIRKVLRNIIANQDGVTGHLTGSGHGSLYHHGFATLALSEAYGLVDDQLLWQSRAKTNHRSSPRTSGSMCFNSSKKEPLGSLALFTGLTGCRHHSLRYGTDGLAWSTKCGH